MDSFNPTTRTQQAISAAAQAASLAGNPDVGPTHLLGALLAQGDGIAAPLLTAVGADPAAVRAENTQLGNRLPSASGSSVAAPQLSRETLAAITAAIAGTAHCWKSRRAGRARTQQGRNRTFGARSPPSRRRSPTLTKTVYRLCGSTRPSCRAPRSGSSAAMAGTCCCCG